MVFSLVPLHMVNASSAVTQPIRVAVDGSGPGASGTLSGCSVSPSTLSFDGQMHNFSATPHCTITITVPADGNGSRYRFGAKTTVSVRTCGSDTCAAVEKVVYLELLNTYVAVPNAQGTFDAGLTFKVTGSLGRTNHATVCTITSKSADTSSSCSGWANFGAPVTLPANPGHQAPRTRWEFNGTRSFTDTGSGNVAYSVDYFKQVRESVYYTMVTPKGTGYLSPVLAYSSLGSTVNYSMTSHSKLLWIDYGTRWSATNPLNGSGSAERWRSLNESAAGEALSPGVVKPSYYHQYADVFLYSVLDPTSPGAPSASYRQFGRTISFNLGSSPSGVWAQVCPKQSCNGPLLWVDAGARVRYQKSMNDSTSTERWVAPTSSFTSSRSAVFNTTYFHQFWVAFGYQTNDSSVIAYSAVGPSDQSSVSIPVGYYYQFGATTGRAILSNGLGGVTPSSAWVDAGTGKVEYLTANSPSGTERWALVSSPDSLNVTSSITTLETGYYHQFALAYSFSLGGLAGGASPIPPALVCNSFGQPYARAILTTTAKTYWCDNGGSWTVYPALLLGSNLTERWMTLQNLAGGVSGAGNAVFTYYHQYLVTFASTIADGQSGLQILSQANALTNLQLLQSSASLSSTSSLLNTDTRINSSQQSSIDPTVTFTQFGSSVTATTARAGISVWVDAGTSFIYANPVSGSTGIERWAAFPLAPITVVLRPVTVNMTYYHQYLETLSYTMNGGGSPAAPVVNFTSFGSTLSQAASTDGSSTAWIDAGSTATYPTSITNGTLYWENCEGQVPPTFTASSSTTFDLSYGSCLLGLMQ